MMNKTRIVIAALCLAATPMTALAEDPVIPIDEFVYCTVCHGVQMMGNPIIKAPRLSGQEAWYVERQLQAFKNGWRGTHEQDVIGREMQPMAAGLTDDQIFDVAVFVAATRSESPASTVTGDADAGAVSYATCSACHGVNGEGNQDLGGPALTELNDWYLLTQLNNYRDGSRGSHPQDTFGQQMRAAMQMLPDDEAIADVVVYIATLGM